MARFRKLALVPVLGLSCALALADEPAPQRIQFEKGKSAATIHATLQVKGDDAGTHAYALRAAAGQVLNVRFDAAEPNAAYNLACPGGGFSGAQGKSWSFTMPQSGDYTITVTGYGAQKSFPYTLEVGVEGKPHPVPPQGLTGTWTLTADPDESIEIKDEHGTLRFAVHALWKGLNWKEYGPNIGEIGGTVPLKNGKAVYQDTELACKLAMTFKGDTLEVEQEGDCGFGANVRADGTYKRTSLCAAPERSEGM
jgi:hypothetical protein